MALEAKRRFVGALQALHGAVKEADVGRPQMFSGSWATTVASAGSWNATAAGIFRSSTTATGQVGFRVAAVPEPATIALASVGIASLAGLDWMKRRKKKATAARLLA